MAAKIEDYAMIGDGRTGALISRSGSIDWLCLPRYDSDACCSALLGTGDNGHWQITPCAEADSKRSYRGDTMVLDTEFFDDSNTVRLTDFMPCSGDEPTVIRQLTGIRGSMRMRFELKLRYDYGLVCPRIRHYDDCWVTVCGSGLATLRGPVDLQQSDDSVFSADIEVSEGQTIAFTLSYGPSFLPPTPPIDAGSALEDTLSFWQKWAGEFRDNEKWQDCQWRDTVMRSLLTLKALTYRPTGALVAALTTSLPEIPGGPSNWDYRFCWLRDATFTLSAFLNAGYQKEATAWRDWMLRAIAAEPSKMRIMYRVDGERRLDEANVDWLSGYDGATPVRIGNKAADQRQIDVVGELLDSLNLIERGGVESNDEILKVTWELADHLEATWQDPGHGLWESRSRPQNYTYSKVMAWVGVDRLLKGHARRGGQSDKDIDRMQALRKRIRDEIMERGWNHARGHFVDRFGGEQLDASLLLMPLVNFLPADDPRMSATIDAIERHLSDDGLVWRKPGTAETAEGAFIACSCWLADCRALQGRRDDAVKILEKVLSLSNDVGLLSEMYHPGLRRLLGNFPQAITHLALINTILGLCGPVLQRGGG